MPDHSRSGGGKPTCQLGDVVITDQLSARNSRPANHELEAEVLCALAAALASSPDTILDTLTEKALEICTADSAGISLEETENGKAVFRWHAVAGKLRPQLGATLPRGFSPCGVVLDRGATQLMKKAERYFPYIADLHLPLEEILLVPFSKNGKVIGTIWVTYDSPEPHFDAEHRRILTSLAEFAAAAVDVHRQIQVRRLLSDDLNSARSEVADILDNVSDAFVAVDSGWKVVRVNAAFENVIGKSKDEFLGKDFLDAFLVGRADEHTKFRASFELAMRDRKPLYFEEYYEPLKLWTACSISPTANGGVAIFLKDVSARRVIERRTAEASTALANEKGVLDDMLAASPSGIALLRGIDFVFEKVNAKFRELVSPREYVGRTWREVYHELADSELPARLAKVFESGEPFYATEAKIRVEKAVGRMEDRYYDFAYIPVRDAVHETYGILCQCVDVTDTVLTRQIAERHSRELARTNAELEKERDLRERFVAALSHDLRTPLSAAKMSAQLLRRRASDEVTVKTAQRIIANMDRSDRMIRDLLDVTRIRAGERLPMSLRECSLNDAVTSAANQLAELYGPRFQIRQDAPAVGFWDCASIERLIENLASNAVKYGAASAPITIGVARDAHFAVLSIHNVGNPISAEDRLTLFEPYRRSQSAVSGGQKGWGIGLMLVKEITEAHHGKLRVESSAAAGTTFFVQLPLDGRKTE